MNYYVAVLVACGNIFQYKTLQDIMMHLIVVFATGQEHKNDRFGVKSLKKASFKKYNIRSSGNSFQPVKSKI